MRKDKHKNIENDYSFLLNRGYKKYNPNFYILQKGKASCRGSWNLRTGQH